MKSFKLLALATGATFALGATAASAATVSLTTAPPGINESLLDSCIFGNPSLSCDAAYQLYTGAPGGTETDRTHVYTVGEIRALVGDVFSVGVDANIATGSAFVQTVTEFTLSILGGADLFTLDHASSIDADVANGNGFTDYIIGVFSLAGLSDATQVVFTLSMTGLTDGAEQFYFLDEPEVVPVPAALWLMGSGLAGLGFAGRRKKKA
jgi:hypothetical protein